MPGDGLALAVVVGGEVELVGALEGLAELGDGLLLVGVDDVVGLEPVLDVDRELAVGALLLSGRQLGGLGQVADVAYGGLDVEVVAQVCGNGTDLVGGLDDDKLGGHGCLPRVSSDGPAPPRGPPGDAGDRRTASCGRL